MGEFHFLRPLWLVALPIGAVLFWRITRSGATVGRWRTFVDEALQPFVLTGAETVYRQHWWLFSGALAAWTLATLALAGPTWERLPVPAFRSNEALVVALDLSRSMDAADLEPSRLARAKLKLLSLLERREAGQTGLVVFSAHAFTVTPLTADTRTIAALVSAVTSDIMPSRGSFPAVGISRAAQLMRQTGLPGGEILVMTDAEVSSAALELARELRAEGFTLHVLAVGTAQGGPIAQPGGGFLTDDVGQVVISQVDAAALQRLAEAGGGRFASLTADDRDLDYLLSEVPLGAAAVLDDSGDFQTDAWRDQGVWLVLALLPLVALGFRRGWVVVWIIGIGLPGPQAHALTWTDFWQRADRQGQEAFDAEDHARAAELFEDPQWRASAQYRSGEFAESAESLAGIDAPDAHYNRGNALAKSGDVGEAIRAYDAALELDPDHEDARYNRDLLLQQPPPEEQQGGEQAESEGDSGDESAESQAQNSSQGEPEESQEGGDPQDEQSGEPEEQQASEESAQSEPQEQQVAGDPMPTPGELEEWVSEQAAEQWLRRIPEDPGGLLRRKFLYQYQRLGIDQEGNYVWPGDEEQPW